MNWYINTEWRNIRKGLRKQVLDLRFERCEKPHKTSTVTFKVSDVKQLNNRTSKLLAVDRSESVQQLEIGSSLTPLDCYVELFILQMIVGERARCYIRLQDKCEVSFVLMLEQIKQSRPLHKLKVDEMFHLALRYKENGVVMFKDYPLFAQEYFSRASKCLIRYKPFVGLTLQKDGIDGNEMNTLFVQIQTNLAACLLLLQRYEDVIYQTNFVESASTEGTPPEKGIYRRAMALFHSKEYEEAQRTIELLPKYQQRKEFVNLQLRIAECLKSSNIDYKKIVKRMFNYELN